MPSGNLSQRLRLLLLLLVTARCAQAAEDSAFSTATFNVTNFISVLINDTALGADSSTIVTFKLRTSHVSWAVWGIAESMQDDASSNATEQWLRLGLASDGLTAEWLGGRSQATANLTDGRWHAVRVRLDNTSAAVSLDASDADVLLVPWTPPMTLPLVMTFGGVNGTGGLRGCLANASISSDAITSVSVQLHANASGAPQLAGCHEDACLCANGGGCRARRQWNLHAGCDCSAAYEGPLCLAARDFCAGQNCSGHGACRSSAEVAGFVCSCAAGWLGSRCQNADPCAGEGPCGTGNCTAVGDPELGPPLGNLSRRCDCPPGWHGPVCTDADAGTAAVDTRLVVGLVLGLVLLLVLGTAAGLLGKLVRDRRKDTGVYKPSDRELGGTEGGRGLHEVLHPPTEERLI